MATSEREGWMLRPADIAAQRFAIARKGYDAEQVDRFLRLLSEQVSRLQGEVEWQRARGEHLERRTTAAQEAAYARLSRDFMDVVRRADEAAGRVRAEAEAQARAEVAAGHREAARLLSAAAEQAEAILTEARAEAERMLRQARGPAEDPPSALDLPAPTSAPVPEPEPTGALSGLLETWRSNGHAQPRRTPHSPSGDPEGGNELDLDLDVSLFDLFEE